VKISRVPVVPTKAKFELNREVLRDFQTASKPGRATKTMPSCTYTSDSSGCSMCCTRMAGFEPDQD